MGESRGGCLALLLVPLVGGRSYEVIWPTPIDSLKVGNLLFCRIVPVDNELTSVGCALHFKASLAKEIKERLEEEYALLGRWNEERLSWSELSAKYADRLYGLAYRAARGFPDED